MAKVHPNRKGREEVLRSREMKDAIGDLAEKVAADVKRAGVDVEGVPGRVALPVRVDTYETDRARATVWLAHPSGLAVQAKHGLLTRAASANKLEVKGD